MSLRRKTLVWFAGVFAVLLGCLYVIVDSILLQSFEELEEHALRQDLHRARLLFQEDVARVGTTAAAWAVCDSAYAYLESRDPSFYTENFSDKALNVFDTHLRAYVTPDADIVCAAHFDTHTGTLAPLPPAFAGERVADPLLQARIRKGEPFCGLRVLPSGPLLVAGHPVLRSDGGGPARGMMIAACTIDKHYALSFAERIDFNVEMLPAHAREPENPEETLEADDVNTPVVYRPDRETVTSRVEISGLSTADRMWIQLSDQRDFYHEGVAAGRYVLATIVLAGVFFTTLGFALVDRLVVRRVRRFGDDLLDIARTWDFSRRLQFRGRDELAGASHAVNVLLAAVGESEAAMQHSTRLLQTLIESIPDPIYYTDSDGVCIGCNSAFVKLLGSTIDATIGRKLSELLPDLQGPLSDAVIAGTSNVAHVVRAERWLTLPGGERRLLDTVRTPYGGPDGQAAGVIAVSRDITERWATQAASQRQAVELQEANARLTEASNQNRALAERAQQANETKSAFLANMSHEIRTPMTAILGYAEELLDCNLPTDERTEAVQAIRRNGQFLLKLINDILDLSKIEAGRLEIEQMDCSVVELLADIESLMRPRASERKLSFTIVFAGTVPETICTDPTRVRQILVNLIGNALKFTRTGGVRVVVRQVDARPPLLAIDVIDTGIGMTPEQVGRLFESFVQADASTTRQFGGTGLGLAISRRLARMLGGDIAAHSVAGEGSTFTVTLTLGVRSAPGVMTPSTAANALAAVHPGRALAAEAAPSTELRLNGRVLLAEDGPDNQRLLSRILRRAGADVAIVDTGMKAVDAALSAIEAGAPFDLILMDMQMPEMDGLEATRLLRRRGYTYPIVALTANAMAQDRERCIAAGCDAHLGKPIDRRVLLEQVTLWLEGRSVAAAADTRCTPPLDTRQY